MKKMPTRFLRVLVCFLACLTAGIAYAQGPAALRFSTATVGGEYCATIQIASEGAPFEIGTSSIYITYNADALEFSSYTSANFDNNDLCFSGVLATYDPHQIDASNDGIANLTITYANTQSLFGFGCPTVGSCWVDVGTYCFTVQNPALSSNLAFSPVPDHISFNSDINDGTIQIPEGTFSSLNEALNGAIGPNCAGFSASASVGACANGSATVTITATGGNAACYSFVNGAAAVADDNTDGVVTITVADGQSYNVTVSSGDGCEDSVSGTVTCGAVFDCPALNANIGDSCNDGDACTTNDVINSSCVCAGTFQDSDGDGICNASDNCPNLSGVQGDACNDGNANTTNDVITSSCVCAGTQAGTPDCNGVINGPAQPGTACNDNNANTINDTWSASCQCVGVAAFDCPSLSANIGDSCNDGDACTTGDVVQSNCTCSGTFQDSDGDGICNASDNCPNLSGVQGDTCNDGNANTTNDIINGNCVCAGTVPGTPDCMGVINGPAQPGTACNDNNANTINDTWSASCQCVGVAAFDCPSLSANIGDSCNDGDACTINDVINSSCVCAGTFQDSDGDGICNASDNCPNLSGVQGNACNDGNANTTNDIINGNCVCAGTPAGTPDCLGVLNGPAQPGTACNDNNASTTNDVWSANCTCAGTLSNISVVAGSINATAGANQTYTVSFSIIGGTGSYSANGGGFTGGNFTSASIPCGTPYSFNVTDGNSSVNVAGDAPCSINNCSNFSVEQTDFNCPQTGGEFTLTLGINGGTAPYAILGTFSDENFFGNSFNISAPDGTNVEITITDANGCIATYFADNVQCIKCNWNISMDNDDPIYVCAGGSANAGDYTITDPDNQYPQNGAVIYAVHTGSGTSAGVILAANSTGVFSLSDLDGGMVETTYYISAVAGPTDANGNVVLDDPCTKVASGRPVVFLTPVTINHEFNLCADDGTNYSIIALVDGGYAGYANTNFTIGGTISTSVAAGSSFGIPNILNGDSYTITANDGVCSSSASGSYSNCEPTAITLVSFTGSVKDAGNLLSWETASEKDNDFFTIERAADGVNFTPVGTMDGAGTSFATHRYELLDVTAPAGISFYRLKQTDYDGQYDYSQVISLTRESATNGIIDISPVPATDHLYVNIASAVNSDVQLSVYDLNGKQVISKKVLVNTGATVIDMNIGHLPVGTYFIQMEDGATYRFVKK